MPILCSRHHLLFNYIFYTLKLSQKFQKSIHFSLAEEKEKRDCLIAVTNYFFLFVFPSIY